jgi:hypothetical protein
LGKILKSKKARVLSNIGPYGFDYVPGKSKFVHNPKEIETAKLILGWALEGKSQREIIKLLHEKEIKPRGGGEYWQRSSLSKLLSQNLDTYAGYWNFNKNHIVEPKNPRNTNKYKREKSSLKANPISERIIVKLPRNLAIITKQQAQQIRQNQERNKSVIRYTKNKYLLRGHLFCSNCEGLNYSDSFHGVAYYRCSDRKRHPFTHTCDGGSYKLKY